MFKIKYYRLNNFKYYIFNIVYVDLTTLLNTGQTDSRRGSLSENFLAKTEQFGGSAARVGVELGGTFHEPGSFDEAPEILLVKSETLQCFHDPLKLQKRKLGRQELEDHGAVPELATEAIQGGGDDAPVIQEHGFCQPVG